MSGIDWLWEAVRKLRKQYEQITAEKDKLYQEYRKLNQKVRQHETVRANLEQLIRRSRKKTGAKKKNLPSRFDRYKSAKIGHNKTIKDMYKLDTVCYNGVKL